MTLALAPAVEIMVNINIFLNVTNITYQCSQRHRSAQNIFNRRQVTRKSVCASRLSCTTYTCCESLCVISSI